MKEKKTKLLGLEVFFLFLSLLFSGLHARVELEAMEEKPIVLVIASYKNANWYKRNLDSVFSQNYSNYRIVYVDDCSPDGTGDLVEQYVSQLGQQDRVTLIKNKVHKVKMVNLYCAVDQYCSDEEIAIILDGDDWLAHENVLSIINKAYSDPDIWMTYGSYVSWPKPTGCCCKPLPEDVK